MAKAGSDTVLFGFSILFCISSSAANTSFYRKGGDVSMVSVLKTIEGISELQCLHRCRRESQCKNSAYERSGEEESTCFLLKDTNSSAAKSEILAKSHFEIPLIGKCK